MTRREWLLRLSEGVVLAGWSGVDLEAEDLPPGVYEPSREHLGQALAGHPMAAGGETELVQVRAATFQPAFFSRGQYQTIVRLAGLMLGEAETAPVVSEVAGWIDLTLSDAGAVRAAARALSPAYRSVAIRFYGAAPVRELEEIDAPKVARDGLTWLDEESQRSHGQSFAALNEPEQIAILKTISDQRAEPGNENPGTRFFRFLKERVIHGFYTSRTGLKELGYRGNAFYASPPGCEHLYA